MAAGLFAVPTAVRAGRKACPVAIRACHLAPACALRADAILRTEAVCAPSLDPLVEDDISKGFVFIILGPIGDSTKLNWLRDWFEFLFAILCSDYPRA